MAVNLVTSEKDQVNIISTFFQQLLSSKGTQMSIIPEKMGVTSTLG